MTSTAVRVALRVRPLTEKELINNCTECLTFIPNEPQILIGTDKSFTYDYVFDTNADQAQIYTNAASPLLNKFVDGFNATILAYGQTGSGKTFSMGTSLDNSVSAENEGIVPRCVVELFQILKAREAQDEDFKFEVNVSFLELYNEDFIDLLNAPQQSKRRSTIINQQNGNSYHNPTEVAIREDIAGNIYWSGVKEEICYGPEEILGYLAQGSLSRTTGSTEMNSVSSRSHAIFSVILKQQKPEMEDGKKVIKSLQSKFHFVDLAGSERLKRTHAQGDRAKEGIAINSGLLALGNVISALGDEARRATHIPYRDSKLTRLLQDSLGGNSQTLMLACVSPADTNFMETLNTLKYANRARNIRNRVVVNQDFAGSSMEVNQLKSLVSRLRMEIASLRAGGHASSSSTTVTTTFANSDSQSLQHESTRLRERLNDMSTQLVQVTSERDTLLMERELGEFMQNDGDDDLFENIGSTKTIQTHPIIEKYLKTIQELTSELDDTKDKLQCLETTQSSLEKTVAFQQQQILLHQKTQQEIQASSSVLQRFSSSQPKSNNSNRRRRFGGRVSANSSATTNGYAARITTKVSARRPIITKSTSTSLRTSNRLKKKTKKSPHQKVYYQKQTDDEYEDEGYVNDLQEDDVRHEEVKESIAKVRADIRKSLQVLELVKPLEDASNSLEEELKAFEEEEKRLHGSSGEMQRLPSDEGRFSLTSSPIEFYTQAIESMAVPTWENPEQQPREIQLDGSSNNEDSIELRMNMNSRLSVSSEQSKYNSQLCRMLHQIQSDIKVKEELVSHLEKSETEFTFMRKKFDEKIAVLQTQLNDTQKEKDMALMKARSGAAIKSDIALHQAQQATTRGNAMIDKQNAEIRHSYETKMKTLMTEIQDLKRKYAHATTTMQSTRNQNESLLRSLKVNVETLKVEKKRLVHRMKLEADRVREQLTKQEKKIQQLQRQHAKSNQVKRRLERENEQQKTVLKKRNEEVVINSNQVKQLTSIMKKAVREGGMLDERMLSKITPILGGHFAVIARGGGHGFPKRHLKRKNPIPVETRVSRKKELLDKALSQYIQGKQAIVEMEQLLIRRERLVEEKLELEEERDQVYDVEKEHEENTGQPMDTIAIELMDERIDLISAEISYLSARIRALQTEAAEEALQAEENGSKNSSPKPAKHVTFVDEILTEPYANDEWADVDSFEEQFSVPPNAAPEVAYEVTSKLIKSFEADECKRIIENLVDDIMDFKMSEYNRQVTVQNLEKNVIDLRRTIIAMKRASITTSAEAERRIRQLGISEDDMLDMMIHDDDDRNSINDYISQADLHPSGTIRQASSSVYQSDPQQNQVSLPNSPVASPPFVTSSFSTIVGNSNSKPKMINTNARPPVPRMVESISKSTSMLTRESTPSPDRFYNMIQKRLSWQQQSMEEDELPNNKSSRFDNPPDFDHYATDHDSSTSSIRSSHLRRASVQSDQLSESSWNQNDIRPPATSSFLTHLNRMPSSELNEYDSYHTPLFTNSVQQQRFMRRPLPPLMPSASTFERPMTPSVFDRLAQTPTRSSIAKKNYRHSSGSVEDLRKRWELEQRPSSAMSGNYS